MSNGNTKTITFEGNPYVFPSDATDAEISAALTQHLNPPKDPYGFSTTGTGGGPESEMSRRHARSRAGKDFTTPEPGVIPWLGRQAGGALEATGGLAVAIPALLKTLSSFMPTNATAMVPEKEQPTPPADVQGVVGPQLEQWGKGEGTTGVESLAHRAAALIPFAGPMASQSGESFGRGEVGRGIVEGAAALAARPRFSGGEIPGKGIGREMLGEGEFKAKSLQYQHVNALATKQHLSTVADAVHTDAQQAMSQVLAKVDEAHPEGAFSKADIQDKVKSAVGELVQIPEKLPPSVAKILKVEEGAVPTVGGRPFNLKDPGDLKAYQRMKESGAFTPDEIKRIEGSDTLTAEQLKQMRSDVGQELARYGEKGVIGAGLKKTYGVLSQELRGAAANAGVETDWLQANNKYSQYAQDFLRGPLKRVLNNQTAAGIMEPLAGASRQSLFDTLQKYKEAGFDVDTNFINNQVGRYGAAKKTLKMAEPGKWDLILAGVSPKAVALRQGAPRLAGSPRTLDYLFGKGAETEIPARQVYPTKAAAMKAAKASPALEEDVLEQARRRAPGAPPEEPTPQSAREARDVEASKRREATSRAAIAKAAAEKAKKRRE